MEEHIEVSEKHEELRVVEPYYRAFEESEMPGYQGRYEDYDYDQNVKVFTDFDKGTLLDRRTKCLDFIADRLCEMHTASESETDFDVDTYSIKGYLVAEGRSYPIFFISFDEEDYIKPQQYAGYLMEESEYLRKYFESNAKAKAS